MLVALLTLLFLGGGDSSVMFGFIAETHDMAKTVIADDGRRDRALDLLNSMKKRTKAFDKNVKKSAKSLGKVWLRHGGDPAEVEAIWQEYFAEVDQYNEEMLDLRYEMTGHVTREEWQAIFSPD